VRFVWCVAQAVPSQGYINKIINLPNRDGLFVSPVEQLSSNLDSRLLVFEAVITTGLANQELCGAQK